MSIVDLDLILYELWNLQNGIKLKDKNWVLLALNDLIYDTRILDNKNWIIDVFNICCYIIDNNFKDALEKIENLMIILKIKRKNLFDKRMVN